MSLLVGRKSLIYLMTFHLVPNIANLNSVEENASLQAHFQIFFCHIMYQGTSVYIDNMFIVISGWLSGYFGCMPWVYYYTALFLIKAYLPFTEQHQYVLHSPTQGEKNSEYHSSCLQSQNDSI